MCENLLQQSSIIEALISRASEYKLKSLLLAEHNHQHKPVMTFSLDNQHEADQLHTLLNFSQSWLPVYDVQQQSLHLGYHVERADDHTIKLYNGLNKTSMHIEHIPPGALMKSKYFLYLNKDHAEDACEFIKNQSNGEYTLFNTIRGMKEFVYSFSTNAPMLPVLSHNSLNMHPETCGHVLRISMLIIDHLDLHLEPSRKNIFDTIRRNLINNYKFHRSRLTQI